METTLIHEDLYGKTYKEILTALHIKENQGDCCGFAEVEVKDGLINISEEQKSKAILIACVLVDYENESCYTSSICNFIFQVDGENGFILGYYLKAGSGSGWSYGAWVSLNYIDREIAKVGW